MGRMKPDRPASQARRGGERPRGGVTRAAVITGLALVAVVAVLGFSLDVDRYAAPRFGAGVPASGPFALLFLLAAAGTILPIGRRLKLGRRELLTVYLIVLAGAPVVSTKIMSTMLARCTIQRYLAATSMPPWQDSFIPLLPHWFGPTEWSAVEGFYHGADSVPWSLWWTPLAMWCSFLVALSVCSVCLILLLQRQWITHERLTFPLAQIPLEMVAESQAKNGRRAARITPAALFWLGLAVSLGLTVFETLRRYYPAVPAVPLGPVTVMPWQPVGPLSGLGEIDVVLWPWLIAIAYLIPRDLSFSCWFFWFVRIGLTVIAVAAGATPQRPQSWWTPDFPAPVYQGAGALLAIGVMAAWSARRHLRHAIRVAFSRRPGRADAQEPLPYRWTVLGLLLSFGWLVCFCWLAGARVGFGIILILLILVYYMTWSRLRAETGMGFLPYPFYPHELMVVPLGRAILRPRDTVVLLSAHWAYVPSTGSGSNSLDVVPGNALESMKIADAAGIQRRPLLLAMAAAFLLSVLIGVYVTLAGIYRQGYYALPSAPHTLRQLHGFSWFVDEYITNPSGVEMPGAIAVGAGMLVTFFLGAMRLRFWWWPFHPIGYLTASTWVMYMYYMPFMVGWLAKTLVVRYGGLRLYRRSVPLAIGFIAGDLLNEILWGAVTLITGQPFRTGRTW